jgi:hypothetical protein
MISPGNCPSSWLPVPGEWTRSVCLRWLESREGLNCAVFMDGGSWNDGCFLAPSNVQVVSGRTLVGSVVRNSIGLDFHEGSHQIVCSILSVGNE